MAAAPWLTIVGLGEDGLEGLGAASRDALARAEIIMGPPRHLSLIPEYDAERVEWPVPFADGLDQLMRFQGRRVVVLASGDPFWFGAGSVLTRSFSPEEWVAHPAPSTFSLAASRLGWPLETTQCFGLHARPFETLRPALAHGQRMIVLLRDGAAVAELGEWLTAQGFGETKIAVLEALGGQNERVRYTAAKAIPYADIAHPVCVGLDMAGTGTALPVAAGRADSWFETDGQITKRPMRALTLSALAPRPGEHLWDIGAGSGSISIEWMLAHPSMTATALEARADRAARIKQNAQSFGLSNRLTVIEGAAPDMLKDLKTPNAIFIGGGLCTAMLEHLWSSLESPVRVVANAVTLESQCVLSDWQKRHGGHLMKVELSNAKPLGSMRGWHAAYPVVQWSGEI